MTTQNAEEIRSAVREHYAEAHEAVGTSCCGPKGTAEGLIGCSLYEGDDAEYLPDAALAGVTWMREPDRARRFTSRPDHLGPRTTGDWGCWPCSTDLLGRRRAPAQSETALSTAVSRSVAVSTLVRTSAG